MNDNLFLYFSILLVFLWLARGLIKGNFGFGAFMVWNMFLAAIPLFLISLLDNFSDNSPIIGILLTILWLLFLPNAYYLLTDLMHLNEDVLVNERGHKSKPSVSYVRGDAMFTLDSFLMFLTVCFGGVMGALSLKIFYDLLIENAFQFRFIILSIVLIASAVGVYIGRYGRWNSWDAIIKPKAVLVDFYQTITNYNTLKDFLTITITILAFEILSLIVVVNYK